MSGARLCFLIQLVCCRRQNSARRFSLKHINKEHIIGITAMLLGVLVLLLTRTFPKGAASSMQLTGPAFFPNLLAVILLLIGVYQIVLGFTIDLKDQEYTLHQFAEDLKKPQSITILIIIGMLVFFVLFIKILGFFTTSALFLLVVLRRFKLVWWKNVLITLTFLAIIYLIFIKIFTTSLPSGFLF